MKAYRLKITCFILLLLPVLTCCTDEELLRGSGVPEGVPTTVDISVGTAANRARQYPDSCGTYRYTAYPRCLDPNGHPSYSSYK